MNNVSIGLSGNSIHVQAPYNTNFVKEARRLGGQWKYNAWVFDRLLEKQVRELCMSNYGTDGIRTSVCVVRVKFDGSEQTICGALEVCGRPVARAFGRDSGARLTEGVSVLEGGFTSGGSMKKWTTSVRPGTVVLIRDFPRAVAEKLIEDGEDWISIEEEVSNTPDVEALRAERARLLARLAEIDVILGE